MSQSRTRGDDEGYYNRIHSTPEWLRKLAGLMPTNQRNGHGTDSQ